MQFDNSKIRRKNPINRNNLFFSEESFQFELELGRNYIEQDLNQTVILYEVDLERTKIDDIYKEAKSSELVFKTPVELNVIFDLDDAELKTYDKQQYKGYYLKTGQLHFSVYEKTLEEMGCDIKRGDYIGVQVTHENIEYFVVTDDGRNNYGNSQMMYGRKPFYRNIECAPVSDEENSLKYY
jgi:hypothetical protein